MVEIQGGTTKESVKMGRSREIDVCMGKVDHTSEGWNEMGTMAADVCKGSEGIEAKSRGNMVLRILL